MNKKDENKITDIPIKNSKCPVCQKNAVWRYQPFCSKHCADVDLGRWLTESYIIETKEEQPAENHKK